MNLSFEIESNTQINTPLSSLSWEGNEIEYELYGKDVLQGSSIIEERKTNHTIL